MPCYHKPPFFNPGARAQRASVLEKLEELMKAEESLEEKQTVLQDAKKELGLLKKKADEYVTVSGWTTLHSTSISILYQTFYFLKSSGNIATNVSAVVIYN